MLQYTTFGMYILGLLLYIIIILRFLSSSVPHQKDLSVTLPTLEIPYGDPTSSADPTPTHIHNPSDDPSTIHLQPNPSYQLLEMGCQQQQWAPSWRMKLNMPNTCNSSYWSLLNEQYTSSNITDLNLELSWTVLCVLYTALVWSNDALTFMMLLV